MCVIAKRFTTTFQNGYTKMTNDKKTNEKLLRDTFRAMDGNVAQEIREAYYKAVEGLRSLADALEEEDAKNPGPQRCEAFFPAKTGVSFIVNL